LKILVTGGAGFIGYHVINALLKDKGNHVIGLDNINDYYSVDLKKSRLHQLGIDIDSSSKKFKSSLFSNFQFYSYDIAYREEIKDLFDSQDIDVVIHLAAQAGVRHSLENPHIYVESNVDGFLNIIEGCRHQNSFQHLIYASSSSVYGDNKNVPFQTTQQLDKPVSLYAATKKANELMAFTYSHLYGIPATGLRFFTVYGPWGRPDMAYFKFAERMVAGKSIDVYNNGEMYRDFTYVDDIVESICRLIPKSPSGENGAPHQLFNIGYGSPVNLLEFIETLEKHLGIKAEKNFMPMQPGDVPRTWADTEDLQKLIGYKPKISLNEGIREFVKWYRSYRDLPSE